MGNATGPPRRRGRSAQAGAGNSTASAECLQLCTPLHGVSSSKLPVKGAMTMKESDSWFGSVHFFLCFGAGCYA
jgi:hypothetical protein